MRILAVDGGSSNTRITLVQNGKVLDRVKLAAGVRLTALSGSNIELLQAVRQGIQDILARNQLEDKNVEAVLASGMIGSELGLYSVPHVTAPTDLTKLAAHTQRVRLPEVCGIPFWFIPGVKNQADSLENADMMRGEETEFLGLCGIAKPEEEVLALLPGTHTKLVTGSGSGAIIGCCTTLGGEMLAALSQNTILRSALPEPLSPTPDRA